MSKHIFTLLAVLCFCMAARSQTATVSGVIKSTDSKPLEAATVSLLKGKDSSLIKLAVTDKSGTYKFENLVYGDYIVAVEAAGYERNIGKIFEITQVRSFVEMDVVKLEAKSKVLTGINITTQRPLIENKIDKTVVNVDASPTNTGLSALEVLEKSPGVTIDNSGNISLKGKQGVIILIDGKPAYLSGENLTNYLKNLSSNQLDQIEIMSQPSAKYDASGNSGVINIKTKKNRSSGLNVTYTTSAIVAKYFKNTNNLTFNWRKGKLNLFGNYGVSYWEGFENLTIDRFSRLNRATIFDRYVEQHSFGRYSGRPQNFKAG